MVHGESPTKCIVPEGKSISIGGKLFRGGDEIPNRFRNKVPKDWRNKAKPAKPKIGDDK